MRPPDLWWLGLCEPTKCVQTKGLTACVSKVAFIVIEILFLRYYWYDFLLRVVKHICQSFGVQIRPGLIRWLVVSRRGIAGFTCCAGTRMFGILFSVFLCIRTLLRTAFNYFLATRDCMFCNFYQMHRGYNRSAQCLQLFPSKRDLR